MLEAWRHSQSGFLGSFVKIWWDWHRSNSLYVYSYVSATGGWRVRFLVVPFPPCGPPLLGCLLAWSWVLAPLFLCLSLSGMLSFCKVRQGFITITLFWTSILSHMVCPKFDSLVSNVEKKGQSKGSTFVSILWLGVQAGGFSKEVPNVPKELVMGQLICLPNQMEFLPMRSLSMLWGS
jgi:hypothetical protein